MTDEGTLEIQWVAVKKLRGNTLNPRKNDDAVPHVAASLRRFGWRHPIVAKPDGEIVAGHTSRIARSRQPRTDPYHLAPDVGAGRWPTSLGSSIGAPASQDRMSLAPMRGNARYSASTRS